MPFLQIFLKNSELKTTHNTFSELFSTTFLEIAVFKSAEQITKSRKIASAQIKTHIFEASQKEGREIFQAEFPVFPCKREVPEVNYTCASIKSVFGISLVTETFIGTVIVSTPLITSTIICCTFIQVYMKIG